MLAGSTTSVPAWYHQPPSHKPETGDNPGPAPQHLPALLATNRKPETTLPLYPNIYLPNPVSRPFPDLTPMYL